MPGVRRRDVKVDARESGRIARLRGEQRDGRTSSCGIKYVISYLAQNPQLLRSSVFFPLGILYRVHQTDTPIISDNLDISAGSLVYPSIPEVGTIHPIHGA